MPGSELTADERMKEHNGTLYIKLDFFFSAVVRKRCRNYAVKITTSAVTEVFTHHCLEAGVELCEEGRFVSLGQDPLLHHRTFNIVILDHHVFLQDLDGVQLFCWLHLCQHYLQSLETSQVKGHKELKRYWILRTDKCWNIFLKYYNH